MLCHQIVAKVSEYSPGGVLGSLDALIEPLEKTCNKQVRVLSCFVLSSHIFLSCLVLSRRALRCLVLLALCCLLSTYVPCLVFVLGCPVLSCIPSCLDVSFIPSCRMYILSCLVLSCLVVHRVLTCLVWSWCVFFRLDVRYGMFTYHTEREKKCMLSLLTFFLFDEPG